MLMLRTVVCYCYLFTWILMVLFTGVPVECSRCRKIEAGISLPDYRRTYLFSGTRYIQYDVSSGVEKKSGRITRLGLRNGNVDAAFLVQGDNYQAVVTSGCHYHRYRAKRTKFRRLQSNGELSDLGLPCNLDAVINVGDSILVFKGCQAWSSDDNSTQFQQDNATANLFFRQFGLPCNLDSLIPLSSGHFLAVTSHTSFWKVDYRSMSVDGPFHTDDLNICSWFLCGEADLTLTRQQNWTNQQEVLSCNGDHRLCPLKLDQVTLPGLHNAGAGFNGGFGFLDCWARNHARTIYQQMKLGIRHLDIDPCYDKCGFVGTCHSYFCGGALCPIIKQTRRFLLEHRDQIVTINFNHEITEPRKVFKELTRYLKAQFGSMLNSEYRQSGQQHWPTLEDSIRSNKRLFVFYSWLIEYNPHYTTYRTNPWIHTESWLRSTWDEVEYTPECSGLIPSTRRKCHERRHEELVEVSGVLTPAFGSCVTQLAAACRPILLDVLQACESLRYRRNKSPNILTVDYPEVNPTDVTSVFHAVYLQNVRNIRQHRGDVCKVQIDAAVFDGWKGMFFSGSTVVVYDFERNIQTESIQLPDALISIDAAFNIPGHRGIYVVKDCQTWQVDSETMANLSQPMSLGISKCDENVTDITVWNETLLLFKAECSVEALPLPLLSSSSLSSSSSSSVPSYLSDIPCNIQASMTSQSQGEQRIYLFQNNGYYWKYDETGARTLLGLVKSLRMDVVQCD